MFSLFVYLLGVVILNTKQESTTQSKHQHLFSITNQWKKVMAMKIALAFEHVEGEKFGCVSENR